MMGAMADIWEKLLLSGIVLVMAVVLRAVLVRVINRAVTVLASRPKERNNDLGAKAAAILAKASGLHDERQRQRVATLGSLLRSVVDVALIVLVVLTLLATFGVPMAPLLASACEQAGVAPATEAAAEVVIFCTECGTALAPQHRFCANCGTPAPAAAAASATV